MLLIIVVSLFVHFVLNVQGKLYYNRFDDRTDGRIRDRAQGIQLRYDQERQLLNAYYPFNPYDYVNGQGQYNTPYGQGQYNTAYGQGQYNTPYGQGQYWNTPYGQGQYNTPYGQGLYYSPYGQGQYYTPYSQGQNNYRPFGQTPYYRGGQNYNDNNDGYAITD